MSKLLMQTFIQININHQPAPAQIDGSSSPTSTISSLQASGLRLPVGDFQLPEKARFWAVLQRGRTFLCQMESFCCSHVTICIFGNWLFCLGPTDGVS